jgi:hypothetical protein
MDMENSFDTVLAKSAPAVPQGVAGTPLTDEWRLAHARVRLYLELLRMSPQQADELAAEAIRLSGMETRGNPAKDSMRALRQLLGEESLQAASMPPLKRGAMVPVEIDRQPWWTVFKKLILRKK